MFVHATRATVMPEMNSPDAVAKIDNSSVVIDDLQLSQIPELKAAFDKSILSSPTAITESGAFHDDTVDVVIAPAASDAIMKLAADKIFHDGTQQAKDYGTNGNVDANLVLDRYSAVFKYQGDYYFVIIQKNSIL
jgi:hypothetical protein